MIGVNKTVTSPRPAQQLEAWLIAKVRANELEDVSALPTTRSLGEKFHTSHGTAFRVLCRLEEKQIVWRHPNGRFFPGWARRAMDRPKPIAIMLRRMMSWSVLCREVIEGFAEECGEQERDLLHIHNKELAAESLPGGAFCVAPVERQVELLRDFLLIQGERISGVLLDELWSDRAINKVIPAGLPAVVFHRRSKIKRIGNVATDSRAGVTLALEHLLECGYERIFLIDPFLGYQPARDCLAEARVAYGALTGRKLSVKQLVSIHDPASERAFMREMIAGKRRCGLLCPEDNASILLAEKLQSAGVALGEQHGLVSLMGTGAIRAGELTCVRFDFREMGKRAGQMLSEGRLEKVLLRPSLQIGASTSHSLAARG